VGGENREGATSTRVLAESALMIALSAALYNLTIYTFPQGGSITPGSMTPVLLLALRRGARVGIAAGAVFGIIALYPVPFVYNPVQFLLDYPIAFGALGLAGFFNKRPVVGVGAGIGGRFASHFVSGLVFFASNAPAGESAIVYSAVYNASYLIPELAISAAAIFALQKRGVLNVKK
jgi:thiamine transporter